MGIPPDFGGLLAVWNNGRLALARCGKGKIVEGIELTPLNALQAQKILAQAIEIGKQDGTITAEHIRQCEQLPAARGLDSIPPRDQVDRIAGPD